MKNYIYILECSDKTLYTGYTNDLEKRVKAHNEGKGAKYTKSRLPVKLVYSEAFDDKKEAMSREWYIKHKLTREEKINLINNQKKQPIDKNHSGCFRYNPQNDFFWQVKNIDKQGFWKDYKRSVFLGFRDYSQTLFFYGFHID